MKTFRQIYELLHPEQRERISSTINPYLREEEGQLDNKAAYSEEEEVLQKEVGVETDVLGPVDALYCTWEETQGRKHQLLNITHTRERFLIYKEVSASVGEVDFALLGLIGRLERMDKWMSNRMIGYSLTN